MQEEKELTLDLEVIKGLLNKYNIVIVKDTKEFSFDFAHQLAAACALLLVALRSLQDKLEAATEAHAKTKERANSEMGRADGFDVELKKLTRK